MKILIVGGGVAGPTLALLLKNHADITLIDKAPKWGNVGYAITLWGTGEKILRELNLESKVLKDGYQIPWDALRDKKGRILKAFTCDIFLPYGPTTVITRASLQQTLVNNLGESIKVKLGTTIFNLTQNEKNVSVTFSDGATDVFDLVVGADGIHSQVRDLVFGTNFLHYYGWNVYAFWTPPGFASPKGIIEFSEAGKICFLYPLEDRAVVMLAVEESRDATRDGAPSKVSLYTTFSDFRGLVEYLIAAIPDEDHIFKDRLARVDMESWYKGRVVLMGDAVHAISPLTGMGSSLALEDAHVLAEELKKVNEDGVLFALDNYERRRSVRIKNFRKVADLLERWIIVKSPIVAVLRDFVIKFIPVSFFTRKLEDILKEEI